MKKYGIFGGTFNPPHIAHLILAEYVRSAMSLKKIIFIPSGNPPLKTSTNIIDSIHRYNMAKLCFEKNKNFIVDDIELENLSVKSYTIDTLKKLRERYKNQNIEFYLIIGTDNFINFHKWKEPEKIFTLCKVIVINRPSYKFEKGSNKFKNRVIRLKVPDIDISSTLIRDMIKQGKSVKYLITEEVEKYIIKNNLYKN